MSKKVLIVMLFALGILLYTTTLWADDDAIMDVDNHSAGFTGSWGYSTNKLLYYGDDYRYAWGAGGKVITATRVATFTTAQTADITGSYAVYVRWSTASNREETARFRIYDGITYRGDCFPDQTKNGGEWRYCNTVTLTKDNNGVVKLGNENCNTDEVVIADGVRFVRVSKDSLDIVDEAGYELSQKSSIASGDLEVCNIAGGSVNWTTLAAITLTTPVNRGIVWIHANGIARFFNDGWSRICIARAGGGCASLAPVLDQSSLEVTEGSWDNETRWVVSDTFPATGGSQTFYLKGCKGGGAYNTDFMWDDFVGFYFPTRQ